MAKLRPGWVGPLKRTNEGKKPYVCDYVDWVSGKKLRHKCGYDREEARLEHHRFVEKMKLKAHAPVKGRTFGDALDEYYRWCTERRKLKQRMSGGYLKYIEQYTRLHIRPALGNVRLDEIDAHMVQKFVNAMAEKYRVAQQPCYVIIKRTLERAVHLDWLGISPLVRKKVTLPPIPKPDTSIPTLEEGRALWHAIQTRSYREGIRTHLNQKATIALAMFGGVEIGMIAALRWEDVDWVNSRIHLRWSYSRTDGIKEPKNKYRIRTIPASAEIRESLAALWERYGLQNPEFVINTKAGSRRAAHSAIDRIYLYSAMAKAGFVTGKGAYWDCKPRWSCHELRHYAGSIWLEAGARIEDVSRWLGHSNIQTTQKHYIHYFQKQQAERQREIVDRVSTMHRLLPAPTPQIDVDAEIVDVEDAEIA
jgi:integrase